ncbi:uncharacterized protein SPPG_07334 [Spizellomyces punctatus DAOM BR117]|uniref:F-box domain-containing protein n=1 Tax=Spizellomyces punctatus (strain DAOM BR117) TaxID=645134 RepID=A0A0L0H795_SPIPD|nr:uncharacterized protein SPPG_07334 [Spizellomyces punctatus DAOM BR117]KNC97410.1 hypothetical protein SPPG_07334 [Spizellomyces punctatus DAOM BR117]|eukprot:XP_016605450.1 hypothetical protein SPPG_07334 [Spizellomyces punctatus DAOM BR117]
MLSAPAQILPAELLCHIFSYLTLREQIQIAVVCKRWSASMGEAREFVARVTDRMAQVGCQRVLKCFPRLKVMELRLHNKNQDALVHFGSTFTGHPTLTHLITETSSILLAALRHTPRLKHLTLKEDFSSPIPHLPRANVNFLYEIFTKGFETLDLDAPLLFAMDTFAEAVDDAFDDKRGTMGKWVLPNLKRLSIRSLQNSSMSDLMTGFMPRVVLTELKHLNLSSNEATLPLACLGYLAHATPNLESLHVAGTWIEGRDAESFVEVLSRRLKEIVLIGCDLPGLDRRDDSINLAEGILTLLTAHLSDVQDIQIIHCKFRTPAHPIHNSHISKGSRTLKRLSLLGFGRTMTSVSFLSYYPALETLKLDDVPNYVPNPSGLGMRYIPLWDFVAGALVNLAELDLRFTRVEDEIDHSIMSDHITTVPPTHLPNLTTLSLYSIPISTLLPILAMHPTLKSITLNHLPATTFPTMLLKPQSHLISLPNLRILHIHAHGPMSPLITRTLATTLTKASQGLHTLHVQSAKPALETHAPTLAALLSPPSPLPPQDAIDSLWISTLMSQCPYIRTLRTSGQTLTHDALARLCAPDAVWKGTLERLEVALRGIPRMDVAYDFLLKALLEEYRILKGLEVCVERLPDDVGPGVELGEVGGRAASRTDDMMEGVEMLARAAEPDWDAVSSSSSPSLSFIEPSQPLSAYTLQSIDTLHAKLCARYADDLKRLAPWLETCRVWAPELKRKWIRSFLLRRMQRRIGGDDMRV